MGKEKGELYFPPTYEQDGFTHATADPSKLLDVLNYFYKDVKEDFVCLRFTQDTLTQQGIVTTFEQTAPVGDIPAIDMGDRLFPHVNGGIPSKNVVLEEMPVLRAQDGTFVDIPGLNGNAGAGSLLSRVKDMKIGLGVGFSAGVLVGALISAMAMSKRGRVNV